MVNQAMQLYCPLQKSYEILGIELGDGNIYTADMMWWCIQLGDANETILLYDPHQKSQEILGTEFGEENIKHFWHDVAVQFRGRW